MIARAAFVVVLLVGSVRAETHRIAIVVGHNTGDREHPLRYAEEDAGKLARALLEVGGVGRDDLFLLQGKPLARLHDALNKVRDRVTEWHRQPDRVVFLFYYSGHSDGTALELAHERVVFGELRQLITGTGADVRVTVIDACKSGALVSAKGGERGQPYHIRLDDDLLSHGEALLTSSAADELALESSEIGASYFTHHFISGLRGAADASGDKLVTLYEAYRYAAAHTTSATAETTLGAQHPAYDYRLSGEGELVLADLQQNRTAWLVLPTGFERVLVVQPLQDQVIAEVPSGAVPRIAVAPGRYAVRGRRNGSWYAARVSVDASAPRVIAESEFVSAMSTPADTKGRLEVSREASPTTTPPLLTAAIGMRRPFLEALPAELAVRLTLSSARATSWMFSGDVSVGPAIGAAETLALVLAGYRIGVDRGPARLAIAIEAGGGWIEQSFDARSRGSVAGAVAVWLGIDIRVSPRLAVEVAGQLPLVYAGGTFALLPGTWVGIGMSL